MEPKFTKKNPFQRIWGINLIKSLIFILNGIGLESIPFDQVVLGYSHKEKNQDILFS